MRDKNSRKLRTMNLNSASRNSTERKWSKAGNQKSDMRSNGRRGEFSRRQQLFPNEQKSRSEKSKSSKQQPAQKSKLKSQNSEIDGRAVQSLSRKETDHRQFFTTTAEEDQLWESNCSSLLPDDSSGRDWLAFDRSDANPSMKKKKTGSCKNCNEKDLLIEELSIQVEELLLTQSDDITPLTSRSRSSSETSDDQYLDIDLVLKKIAELNFVMTESGGEITSQNDHSRSSQDIKSGGFSKAPILNITFYKNGFQLENETIFRHYRQNDSRAFIRDICDGYFPSLLQRKYPEGVLFLVIDKRFEKSPPIGTLPFAGKGFSLSNTKSVVTLPHLQITTTNIGDKVISPLGNRNLKPLAMTKGSGSRKSLPSKSRNKPASSKSMPFRVLTVS